MISSPLAVDPDGFRTFVPESPPIAAESATWGSTKPPMSLTIAFGAFQAIHGPLMKLIGARHGLVSWSLIPARISCWVRARSVSL